MNVLEAFEIARTKEQSDAEAEYSTLLLEYAESESVYYFRCVLMPGYIRGIVGGTCVDVVDKATGRLGWVEVADPIHPDGLDTTDFIWHTIPGREREKAEAEKAWAEEERLEQEAIARQEAEDAEEEARNAGASRGETLFS